MIRISASVSKKVPIRGLQYSSQNFSAGMEVEVSCGSDAGEIRDKLRKLHRLLARSVDEQIEEQEAWNGGAPATSPEDDRGGNGRTATRAQLRAIRAIAREQGFSEDEVRSHIGDYYGVVRLDELSVKEASDLIDDLKAGTR